MDERADPPESHDLPTLAAGAGTGADRRFPVADWGSYEIREYLGSGAMGSVYRAWDRQLQRPVALKFLLGENPALIERFQNEARAQARVEHDNLCKIYEVGETGGRHYIAMQFIDGEPLHRAGRNMTLTDKVVAVRDIARGLHEAHRAGLIHRDIKPSNIMVSRGDDGRWKPFVLDFGLAREAQAAGMTMTGAVVGTPAYMAPEQARGEIHKLDRRSDVYGLGATLYDLLTDRPPFSGETLHTILPQVLDDVPRPPRDTHPEVPADVESIALKCLRKDPAERYESARALADDLQRYLDGDAVLARPTSAWYRLRMKARKNRTAVRVAAVLLPLMVAGVAWGVWNQWTSGRQQELAQDFGQKVQRMESIARIAAMAPLHDIRPERDMIRRQMEEIEGSMRQAGSLGRGPGQYALGRGHLALGEVDDAREHLESAWEAGYRPPEVSYALGLVLGRQYQDRLQEIATIKDEEERQEQRAQAELDLRDPALQHLRSAATVETESPEYLEGLLAFHEGRADDALDSARRAFERHGWLYEAKLLEGEILLSKADDEMNLGEYDHASELHRSSIAALNEAALVARSAPEVRIALARVARAQMVLEMNHRGLDVGPAFQSGLEAIGQSLRADPDDPAAHVTLAWLHKRLAEYRISQGQPVDEHLEAAIAEAQRAAELDSTRSDAFQIIGSSYRELGKELRRKGDDPRPAFAKAIEANEMVARLNPDWVLLATNGLLFKDIALWQEGVGEDPRETFGKAIASYERSLELRPRELSTLYNLGSAFRFLATHEAERGRDALDSLDRSVATFQSARELSPDHPLVLQSLGGAYNDRALSRLSRGEDPWTDLELAVEVLSSAIETNQESAYLPYFLDGRGIAHTTRARALIAQGRDPDESFDLARKDFLASIETNPDYVYARSNLCFLEATVADFRVSNGLDPDPAVRAATKSAERGLDVDPTTVAFWASIADALSARARWEIEHGTDPTTTVREMTRCLDRIRAENPENLDGYRLLATIRGLEAEWVARTGDPEDLFEKASRAAQQAIDLAPNRADLNFLLADLCERRARAATPGGSEDWIQRGTRAVAAALERNPRMADALLLRASLSIIKARSMPGPSREAILRAAEADLERAVELKGTIASRASALRDELFLLRDPERRA